MYDTTLIRRRKNRNRNKQQKKGWIPGRIKKHLHLVNPYILEMVQANRAVCMGQEESIPSTQGGQSSMVKIPHHRAEGTIRTVRRRRVHAKPDGRSCTEGCWLFALTPAEQHRHHLKTRSKLRGFAFLTCSYYEHLYEAFSEISADS